MFAFLAALAVFCLAASAGARAGATQALAVAYAAAPNSPQRVLFDASGSCGSDADCCSSGLTFCAGGQCSLCPEGCEYDTANGICENPDGSACAAQPPSSACSIPVTVISGASDAACSSDANCPCGSSDTYCVGGYCSACAKGCYYVGNDICVTASNTLCNYPAQSTDCDSNTVSSTSLSTSSQVSQVQPMVADFPSLGVSVTVQTDSPTAQAASVSVADAMFSSPAAPSGLNKLAAVDIEVSSQASTSTEATVGFPCSVPSAGVAPYALSGGSWSEITSFSVESSTCALTFAVPSDPVVAIMQSTGSGGGGSVSSASAPGCSNYCNVGTSTSGCSSSTTADGTGSGGGSVISSCYLVDTFDTDYQSGSALSSSGRSGPYDVSPANSVNYYNVQNSLELLTCPMAPELSPTDRSYFYTYPFTGVYPYVAGDACTPLASSVLATTVKLETDFSGVGAIVGEYYTGQFTYTWSGNCNELTNPSLNGCIETETPIMGDVYASFADAVINNPHLTVLGAAALSMNDLAYSPMIGGAAGGVVSSAFGTNRYIFQPIPASGQHSVWTWTAQFADFSNAQPDSQTSTQTNLQTSYGWTAPCLQQCCDWTTSYSCSESYTLSETTGLSGVSNFYIPFNEVTSSDGSQEQQMNSEIVPYFTFNSEIPSTSGEQMSWSYDVFSPWNYHSPANTEEMFPVNTPGATMLNYQNSYALALPDGALGDNTVLQEGLDAAPSTAPAWPSTMTKLGVGNPNVVGPIIAISGAPSGDIYVLNESKPSGTYWITILKPVPQGDFNASNYQPTGIPDAYSESQWNSEWNGYWANVIAMQSNSLYVVGTININQLLTQGGYDSQLAAAGKLGGFVPVGMSIDDKGDVFMAGSTGAVIGSGWPAIVEVTNTLTPSEINEVSTPVSWSESSGISALTEVAASPSGGLVFAANPNDGAVYVFSGTTLASDYIMNLTYSSGSGAGGYGAAMLNITAYLHNGGPYGVAMDGSGASGIPTPDVSSGGNNANPSEDLDSNLFHHPLGLQDVNGYLYVLDDWRGVAGAAESCLVTCTFGGGTKFDILTVRVINATGSSLPIDPTLSDDVWQTQTCPNPAFGSGSGAVQADVDTCYKDGTPVVGAPTELPTCGGDCQPSVSKCNLPGIWQTTDIGTQYACDSKSSGGSTYYTLSTGQYVSNSYPPYGWVLSADIVPSGGGEVTFCSSSSCTVNPSDLPATYTGGYAPVGPKLSVSDGEISGASFTVNFNGTMDILLQQPSAASSFLSIALGNILCQASFGIFPCGSASNPSSYSSLITANLNILNYTKVLQGQPTYACYTTDAGDKGNTGAGCKYLAELGSDISGPVYSFPNPLEYIESVGGAQSLSFGEQVASAYPSSPTAQGCQSSLSSGQGCTSNALYDAGPPSLTIQQYPAEWGQTDVITAKAGVATDEVQVFFDGSVMAQGTGTAVYTLCSSPTQSTSDCPPPGKYPVYVEDTNTLTTTPASGTETLTIRAAPLLVLQSPVVDIAQSGGGAICTGDLLVANAINGAGSVTLTLYGPGGGAVGGSTGAGSANYVIPTSGGACDEIASMGTGTYKVTAQVAGQDTVSQDLYVTASSAVASSSSLLPTSLKLTSSVGGYVMVPYEYTYQLSQDWSGGRIDQSKSYTTTVTCPCDCQTGSGTCNIPCTVDVHKGADCPWTTPPESDNKDLLKANQGFYNQPETNTVYSYAIVSTQSNQLAAIVEGGDTYLLNAQMGSLYVPNMSDAGAIVPKDILYTLQNNRLFGSIYVNGTYCTPGGDCSANGQAVLNATRLYQYYVDSYTQPGYGGAAGGGYATLEAVGTSVPNSASLAAASQSQEAVPTSNALAFLYQVVGLPHFLSVFDLYKAVAYQNPLYLYLNSSQWVQNGATVNALGYHRLVYVMEDRFGNRIMAPLDVDVANPVTIALNVSAEVDQANSNQSVLDVSGNIGSYSNFGTTFTPLPGDQSVYLYYDSDINYVSYNPLTDPLDAVACAYTVNGLADKLNCIQSNPNYVGREANSAQLTFSAAYNSIGQCNPPPNSLLAKSWTPCNVYGSGGLSTTCPENGAGKEEFCMPIYANGTGECTSQLGLFAIVHPDANGNFNTIITACGSRQDQIEAVYYGWPSPQPISVTQAPLSLSENDVDSGGQVMTSNEFNYYYAPNQTTTQFEIGLFELNYGNLGIEVVVVAVVAAVALMLLRKGKPKGKGAMKRGTKKASRKGNKK